MAARTTGVARSRSWAKAQLIPPVYGPAFKDAIAGAKLVSVPEAGHMVIMEKPAEVARAVEAVA